jgi:hypothetical protein
MWLFVDQPTYEKVIKAFYSNEGRHFGALDSLVNTRLVEAGHKDGTSAYFLSRVGSTSLSTSHRTDTKTKSVPCTTKRTRSPARQMSRVTRSPNSRNKRNRHSRTTRKAAKSQERAPTAHNEPHPRCLFVLPDLGNPTILGGLEWWQEYGALLKKTGHLKTILKAKCVDRMQFGDGPSHTPLFVAL